jgi:hypothetical protein
MGRGKMALVNSGAVERGSFLRSLLTYFGPALIVSVAYIEMMRIQAFLEGT